ncbi:MAG: hypothetical protein HQL74_14880 [Magnetococcales bacterium]|nr:hypothetical protein [Magnetococcales bacterium]
MYYPKKIFIQIEDRYISSQINKIFLDVDLFNVLTNVSWYESLHERKYIVGFLRNKKGEIVYSYGYIDGLRLRIDHQDSSSISESEDICDFWLSEFKKRCYKIVCGDKTFDYIDFCRMFDESQYGKIIIRMVSKAKAEATRQNWALNSSKRLIEELDKAVELLDLIKENLQLSINEKNLNMLYKNMNDDINISEIVNIKYAIWQHRDLFPLFSGDLIGLDRYAFVSKFTPLRHYVSNYLVHAWFRDDLIDFALVDALIFQEIVSFISDISHKKPRSRYFFTKNKPDLHSIIKRAMRDAYYSLRGYSISVVNVKSALQKAGDNGILWPNEVYAILDDSISRTQVWSGLSDDLFNRW